MTGATAVMYAMAPIALGSLQLSDGDRPRSYRMPLPRVILPTAFVSANLILYWGGYDVNLKVIGAIAVGLVVFTIGSRRSTAPMRSPPSRTRGGSRSGWAASC